MNEFKVIAGVPVPPRGGGRRTKYPFAQMKPGDSFAVPEDLRGSIARSACDYGQRQKPGWTFCVRRDETGSYRCWRIT